MSTKFENYAREQINSQETEVDTEALWNDIYPHVKKDKKSRKPFLIFFLGLFVGLTAFGVFYFNQDTNEEVAIPKADLKLIDEIQPTAMNQFLNKEAVISAPSVNLLTLDEVEANTAATNKVLAGTGTSNGDYLDTNNSNTASKKEVQLPYPSTIISRNQNDVKIPSLVIKKQTSSIVSFLHTSIKQPVSNHKKGLKMPELTIAFNETLENEPKNTSSSSSKFKLGLYGGYSKSIYNLEAKNVADENYASLRNDSEEQLETLHLGLSATIQTKRNFHLRTGLEYTRIASLLRRNANTTSIDTIPGIKEIQINGLTGDTTLVEGSILRTTTFSYIKKSYNYFHLVDVPVIIGYNFDQGDWSFDIEAGIYVNLFVKAEGDILLADESFYNKESDSKEWYKTNLGISPYLGFNAAYQISDRTQVYVSPGFRFNSIFSTEPNPLKEERALLGIRAGIMIGF